jgi:hypothetical protein
MENPDQDPRIIQLKESANKFRESFRTIEAANYLVKLYFSERQIWNEFIKGGKTRELVHQEKNSALEDIRKLYSELNMEYPGKFIQRILKEIIDPENEYPGLIDFVINKKTD